MKILIAIDSSAYADKVLEAVAGRVWPEGSEFLLLTVVGAGSSWATQEELTHQAQVILDGRLKELRSKMKQHTLTSEVAVGSAGPVIVETAQHWGADYVILGSHGDTGIRKPGVGSVAAAVVNQAPCSIEIIKLPAKAKNGRNRHSAVANASR